MRKRIINKTSDLPIEFSIKNYDATAEFGLLDWLVNLEFRALRWNTFRITSVEERRVGSSYLFKNALLPEPVCAAYAKSGLTKTVHTSQIRDQSVYDALSARHYFEADSRLNKYTKLFLETCEDSFEKDGYNILVSTSMYKALDEGKIDVDGEAVVVVNLQASEEQLIEDFRSWVRSTKKTMAIEVPRKAITSAELGEFSRFKVLAHLDLTFWAATEGIEISNQALGLALFPNEYDIVLSERVRKVVAPLARRLTTYDFCTFLRSQASPLLADPKTVKFVPDERKTLLGPVRAGQQVFPEEPDTQTMTIQSQE
jgi:hypothetical protein